MRTETRTHLRTYQSMWASICLSCSPNLSFDLPPPPPPPPLYSLPALHSCPFCVRYRYYDCISPDQQEIDPQPTTCQSRPHAYCDQDTIVVGAKRGEKSCSREPSATAIELSVLAAASCRADRISNKSPVGEEPMKREIPGQDQDRHQQDNGSRPSSTQPSSCRLHLQEVEKPSAENHLAQQQILPSARAAHGKEKGREERRLGPHTLQVPQHKLPPRPPGVQHAVGQQTKMGHVKLSNTRSLPALALPASGPAVVAMVDGAGEDLAASSVVEICSDSGEERSSRALVGRFWAAGTREEGQACHGNERRGRVLYYFSCSVLFFCSFVSLFHSFSFTASLA